jgi:hypothetical protein
MRGVESAMKAAILSADGFRYTAEIRELDRPRGAWSFSIASTWAAAKDPAAERTTLQITLDREGLLALRGLIDAELQP